MAPRYPAIPEPTTEATSLRDAVLSLKQAFEILTGQRGNPAYAAVVGPLPEPPAPLPPVSTLPANSITVTPAGNIAATNVQAALAELDTEKVAKAGDTMTGHLSLPVTPAAANAVRRDYVDTADALKVAKAGDTMTNFLTLHADPTALLHASTKQYVDNSIGAIPVVRSYLAGLEMAWVSNTSFSVAAGVAADSTNAVMMTLPSSLTKTTALWGVGNAGGLDTGTIGASAWYHVYLMRRSDTGVVDVCYSLNAFVPTTGGAGIPAAYDKFRRIGSMKTLASVFQSYVQRGDECLWTTPAFDGSGLATTNANRTLYTLTVPTSVQVWAHNRIQVATTTAGAGLVISSPDEADVAPGFAAGSGGYSIRGSAATAGDSMAQHFTTRTDTSARIGIRAFVVGPTVSIVTRGWIDRRGQDA